MAEPFKILDQFGRSYIGSNQLFDSARQTRDRPAPPRVDRDTRQNISHFGYRQLMAAGRYIYANCPPLRNAINTQAELAIGNAYLPQHYGRNKKWSRNAQDLLNEWHKIMDIRGGVFDWQTNLKIWLKSYKRDGDLGIMLVDDGYPMVQTILGHRIGSWLGEQGIVEDGPYKGMDLRNGVISNQYGRAIAYRIYNADQSTYRDVSAVTLTDDNGNITQTCDMRLWFNPDWADQGRGISGVASGVPDWADRKQSNDFLKMALKKEASFAVVEYNESGTVDAQVAFTRIGNNTGLPQAAIYMEETEGGLTQIYKAGTGSKIEFPAGERPSERNQAFWEKITRDAFQSIGWPMEFYDSMAKGGAALRLIMELAQPAIEADQAMAQKIATWIDGWRLAKAIKRGELPPDPDWWMITHQPPAEITADKGYSAQIDREDFKLGFTTFKEVCSRRGKWWEDEREQQQEEISDLAARASQLSQENPDLTFEMAINLLQQRSANIPSAPTVTENEDAEATGNENEDEKP